jgi:hypothetical protein
LAIAAPRFRDFSAFVAVALLPRLFSVPARQSDLELGESVLARALTVAGA